MEQPAQVTTTAVDMTKRTAVARGNGAIVTVPSHWKDREVLVLLLPLNP